MIFARLSISPSACRFMHLLRQYLIAASVAGKSEIPWFAASPAGVPPEWVRCTAPCPKFFEIYRKGQKNGFNHGDAIAEAASRLAMRLVAVKSDEQSNLQTLHRI